MKKWWVDEMWPILKNWGENFMASWNSSIWPSIQFWALVLVVGAILFFICRAIKKRFNVNRWIFIGILFFTIIAIPAIIYLDSDIAWGVFLASLLGFIGSVIVEKYVDDKEGIDAKEKEKHDNQNIISLIKNEIESNAKIASDIRDYMALIEKIDGDGFVKRPKDCFHLRFQTASKNSLWMPFVKAIDNTELVDKVARTYSLAEYCNNTLADISTFINNRLQGGNIAGSYQQAVRAMPWSAQLEVALDSIKSLSIQITKALTSTYTESK